MKRMHSHRKPVFTHTVTFSFASANPTCTRRPPLSISKYDSRGNILEPSALCPASKQKSSMFNPSSSIESLFGTSGGLSTQRTFRYMTPASTPLRLLARQPPQVRPPLTRLCHCNYAEAPSSSTGMGVGSLELMRCVAPAKDSVSDVSSLVNRGSDSFRRRFGPMSGEMTCTSAGSTFSGSV